MECWVGKDKFNCRFGPSFIDHSVNSSQVEKIRKQLIRERICRTVFDPQGLHVTFIELGNIRSIQEAMEGWGYRADRERIRDGYMQLFDQFKELPQEPIKIRTEGLKTFYRVLVISLNKKGEWMRMRRELTPKVLEMLQGLGISDVKGFVGKHPKLCRLNESEFEPHISLGVGYSPRYHEIEADGLSITLQPPRLRVCRDDMAESLVHALAG